MSFATVAQRRALLEEVVARSHRHNLRLAQVMDAQPASVAAHWRLIAEDASDWGSLDRRLTRVRRVLSVLEGEATGWDSDSLLTCAKGLCLTRSVARAVGHCNYILNAERGASLDFSKHAGSKTMALCGYISLYLDIWDREVLS